MKKLVTIILVSAFAFIIPTNVIAQQSSVPACHSLGVEVYTLYGTSSNVMQSLDNLPKLSRARVYMALIEAADSAELALYERAEGQTVKVSSWRGASVGDLREKIDSVILATRGSSCAGEKTREIVSQRFALQDTTIPAPATARVAFGSKIESHKNDVMRVTVYFHCGAAQQMN